MSHRSALAALRAARTGGASRLDSYQVQDKGSIYEEVDEEGYKKVVRSRLNQDDFVVDDNGEGYADDGREEWQTERQHYSSDEDEEQPLRGKAAKRKREEDEEKAAKNNHKIMNYFNNGAPAVAAKPKVSLLVLRESGADISRFKPQLRMKLSWLIYSVKLTQTWQAHLLTTGRLSSQIHVEK